jgi:hypothetical protein
MEIRRREEQLAKRFDPNRDTLEPDANRKSVRLVQFSKHDSFIPSTDAGRSNEASAEQSANARESIVVNFEFEAK